LERQEGSKLLDEAVAHRSAVVAHAELDMVSLVEKQRPRMEELREIREAAAALLVVIHQRLDALPPSPMAAGAEEFNVGSNTVQQLCNLWATYIGARAQVSQLKASVLAQPSMTLAFECKVAQEEANVAATAAAAALPAAFDAAEKFLAEVGPARLRRTKQSLEDRASAVRQIMVQVEGAQSEVGPTLEAVEALLDRLQNFRVAEVGNECAARVALIRQSIIRLHM
jgi:hypothetical protein